MQLFLPSNMELLRLVASKDLYRDVLMGFRLIPKPPTRPASVNGAWGLLGLAAYS